MRTTLTILIIEDNKSDASIIKEILLNSKQIQYNIILADRLSKAYICLKGNNIDIILLDLNLPDSYGLETVSKVELHANNIPIIVLTGLDNEEVGLKAIEIGAQDYLIKDQIDFNLLDRFIKYSIEREQLKQNLEKTKEQFQNIIAKNKDGTIIVLEENRLIQYINPAAERFFESSSDELSGQLFGYAFSTNQIKEIEFTTKCGNTKFAELQTVNLIWNDKKAYCITLQNITERKEYTKKREFYASLLEKLNEKKNLHLMMKEIINLIRAFTGFHSIGIRLKKGEDFPYYVTSGFSDDFVEAENYICERDHKGEIIKDSEGNPYLECMCGNILCGRIDLNMPFYTKYGSFWTNCTTELLVSTTEEQRQARTRNRCNGEGYETVALIPLKSEEDIIGLLLNFK